MNTTLEQIQNDRQITKIEISSYTLNGSFSLNFEDPIYQDGKMELKDLTFTCTITIDYSQQEPVIIVDLIPSAGSVQYAGQDVSGPVLDELPEILKQIIMEKALGD
ncbi:MAG: hypothetical protein SNJ78_05520 [Spirochaetales bacterium]